MAMTKVIKAFFDSQSKKKCLLFYKWREHASSITKAVKAQKAEQDYNKRAKQEKAKIDEFELNLIEHKEKLIENQIESLLYSFSIDTLNGFLNL